MARIGSTAKIGLMAVASFGWVGLGVTMAQPHPQSGYQVAKRANPIVLDGQPTNASEWSEAEYRSGMWYEVDGPWADQRSPFRSGFRLVWDPLPTGGLYVWGELEHRGPSINQSGPIVTDGSLDLVQLFLDPNLDGEDGSNTAADQPDGYQFSFNVTGPTPAASPAVQTLLNGGQVSTDNLPMSINAHVNSLVGDQGGMTYAGNPPELTGSGLSFASRGTISGWSFEMYVPWTMFDACTGGPNENGDGLCLPFDSLLGTPMENDQWHFNMAMKFLDGAQTHSPSFAAFPGDNAESTPAAWPHPSITFVDKYKPAFSPSDLNQDAAVDALDASLLFSNWGQTGLGDINQDTFIDAADAGIMFESWTGDALVSEVPEPSCGLGVMLCSVLFARRGFAAAKSG